MAACGCGYSRTQKDAQGRFKRLKACPKHKGKPRSKK